jgi:hypothetical protein
VATSAEWILSSFLYHEGIMVSSTVGAVGSVDSSPHYFGFDKSTSKPVSKVQEYVYLPTGTADSFPARQSHAHNLQHFRDAKTVDEDEESSHLSTPLATCANKITASVMQVHEVKAPKLWSAERPNVYTLVMSLRNTTDGSVVQAESCRVAFRSVDVNYGLLRVNAKPVMIRGTNLHEHDPYRGSTVSPRVVEADIQLMKRSNINAIRTANYPHAPWLYELCTLYGLYVINEANICTNIGVGAGDGNVNILADDSDWEQAYMLRLVRMFERDKVHASIIAWSLGSDSGYGRVHDRMANWIGDRDTSRLVMYEPASYGPRMSGNAPGNLNSAPKKVNTVKSRHKRANVHMATDVLCPKYARVSECIVLGNRHPDLPCILMEYSDMRGNSGGNLVDYWTAFNTYTRLQGGFLFSWSDQGLYMTNSQKDSYWGGFGHFGGVINQTTTDPTYSRWGNNPPGQASPLGLYPETILLQLAKRNSIKGRVNDDHYTPFTNGMGQGATPYPYIRYGSKKTGVEASMHTAGGLTWPDRGIQDKAMFEAYDLSATKAKDSKESILPPAKVKEKFSNFRYSDMYGLCPPPLYHKSFYKLLFTTALSDDSLILSQAVAKPQLLEAKYCMTPFDCFIETVNVKETPVEPVVLNRYNHATASYEPIAPEIPSNCKLSQLKVSTNMNIINLLDHVDDITDELTFDALLLCNGLVVCASSLRAEASAVVHCTYNEESGRPTFQELEALGDFEVTLISRNDSDSSLNAFLSDHPQKGESNAKSGTSADIDKHMKKTLCGVKCPEDILLVPYCKEDINSLIQEASQEFRAALTENYDNKHASNTSDKSRHSLFGGSVETEKKNQFFTTTVLCSSCLWSVVVLGRTLKDTSWAPLGYPLGMKQCKISNKIFLESQSVTAPSQTPASAKGDEKKTFEVKKRKSITLTPTKKKKYLQYEPSIASSSTSTGIPVSRHARNTQEVIGAEDTDLYDISVLWVDPPALGRDNLPLHSDTGITSDKDILLRAVAIVDSGIKSPVSKEVKLVEVRVSGTTGCLLSYQVDGVEVLTPPATASASASASASAAAAASDSQASSCFQLHRAPTVVDRGGYLTAWRAVGMDQAFVMQPLAKKSTQHSSSSPSSKSKKNSSHEAKKRPPVANKPVTGSTDLQHVQVEHVFIHQPSPGRDKPGHGKGGKSTAQIGFGQGIQCKWEMAPATVDKGRVLLLLQIQQFVNDSRVRSKVIEVRSNGQEAFVHEVSERVLACRDIAYIYM